MCIRDSFDTAASLPKGSPARKRLLTVVVVGGGFSGVECFAEICDLVRIMLKPVSYTHLDVYKRQR